MKIISVYSLIFGLSLAAALAAPRPDVSNLPVGVQQAIKESKGKVTSVETRQVDGRTVYDVEFQEKGQTTRTVFSESGSVIANEQPLSRGKGKGKGKAKGRSNREAAEEVQSAPEKAVKEAPAAPAPPPQPTAPAPAPVNPRIITSQPQPAPVPEQVRPAPVPPPVRSSADVKREVDSRVRRINSLQENPAAAKAGLAAISKETGIPVARLQAQLTERQVGFGALLMMNEMAKTGGKKPIDLMSQRERGRDWDRLAAENKYDLATGLQKLQRVQQAMEPQQKQIKR